jgi:uroporphyrin-III C-methyltransferase
MDFQLLTVGTDSWEHNVSSLTLPIIPFSVVSKVENEAHPFPALMNILEATLNLEYLYLRYTSPHTASRSPTSRDRPNYHAHAPIVGFAAATMTVSKTFLYFLQGVSS